MTSPGKSRSLTSLKVLSSLCKKCDKNLFFYRRGKHFLIVETTANRWARSRFLLVFSRVQASFAGKTEVFRQVELCLIGSIYCEQLRSSLHTKKTRLKIAVEGVSTVENFTYIWLGEWRVKIIKKDLWTSEANLVLVNSIVGNQIKLIATWKILIKLSRVWIKFKRS